MQSLSNKLIADYTEMANKYLDVPVLSEGDVQISLTALSRILSHQPIEENLNPVLNHKIEALKEMLEQPELYAKQENCPSFKHIVAFRISKKIEELKGLFSNEKAESKEDSELTAEIARHKQHIQEVQQGKSTVAQATPPVEGSEAHTISVEQQMREMQAQFQNEAQPGIRSANRLVQNNRRFTQNILVNLNQNQSLGRGRQPISTRGF